MRITILIVVGLVLFGCQTKKMSRPDGYYVHMNGKGYLTIDEAVKACDEKPCTVTISEDYKGPESKDFVVSKKGYKIYTGANEAVIVDYRKP